MLLSVLATGWYLVWVTPTQKDGFTPAAHGPYATEKECDQAWVNLGFDLMQRTTVSPAIAGSEIDWELYQASTYTCKPVKTKATR